MRLILGGAAIIAAIYFITKLLGELDKDLNKAFRDIDKKGK